VEAIRRPERWDRRCDTGGVTEGGERDVDLEKILIGGVERRPIVVVDYDPAWAQRFELERERIKRAIDDVALRIEHIGSTAVPGLAAKPIIDVLLVVEDPDDPAAFEPPLLEAGYELRVRERGHRMFRTPERDVHVHVRAARDPEVDRHVLLRDHLRSSPRDQARYAELKRSLAKRDWEDMNHYADAKGPLIREILARAGAARETRRTIRPAAAGDAMAVAGLLGELGYPTAPDDARERLARLLEDREAGALVYELAGEPVGLLTHQLSHLIYRPTPAFRITALVVRADRRRRGIARELLTEAESLAGRHHCFRLELTTRPDRKQALGLYLAYGFHERPHRLVKPLGAR
jgi:GrpB-like predicted nucleotidyltransferase (UPF0157 family)/ribosomal protein S18 acetylase RimI-like enzyme